jgi:hypothetical protein
LVVRTVAVAETTSLPSSAVVRRDATTGLVRSMTDVQSGLTPVSSAAPVTIARAFLRAHADDFGVPTTRIAGLVVRKQFRLSNGSRVVDFDQRVAGLRVRDAGMTSVIDADGRLVSVAGTLTAARADGAVAVSARSALDTSAAVQFAVPQRPLTEADDTAPMRRTFPNVYARGLDNPAPVSAELVWVQPDPGAPLHAAWLTSVETTGASWYETTVDATTGVVLDRRSLYADLGPEGDVYREQNPGVTGSSQQITPLTGRDGSWVTARTTSGNNVNAYLDRTEDNLNNEYQPQTPASPDPAFQHFDYTFTDAWRTTADVNSQTAIDADRDPILTQLFYYTNVMHDWLYRFGFDEASGNFQVDNFGRGGSGNDPVLAEAQDGWNFGCMSQPPNPVAIRCLNNANFATPGDGSSPRMQMYMWAPGRPYRDGDMDGDVIAHEYGHGVSSRLVGGGQLNYSEDQRGALGEGWSDVISFLKWDDPVIGEYVTGNATTGIRSVAYNNSGRTYGSFNTSSGNTHSNGEIWASTLYDIRAKIPGGIDAMAQLVLDGMKATPANPDFIDARDGLLTADGGRNRCLIWSAFAGRGLGTGSTIANRNAVPTSSSAIPADCTPTAHAGGPYTTPEGTDKQLDGSTSAKGSHASAGSISYAWDLDNDGQYDDSTSATPTFTNVGQDGVFTVGLRVTDAFGNVSTDSTTVTVLNVAPTVTIDAITPVDELGTVTVTGVVSDPGWLDPLTATIDFGDGAGAVALAGTVENLRPDATLSFSVQHQYGDNGSFGVEVCAADDDTTGNCGTRAAAVLNVDPTVTIDTGGQIAFDGVKAFVAHVGMPVTVPLALTDPGSDDLTAIWRWGDGSGASSVTSLVNPPATDPAKSPSVQPRALTVTGQHAYGDACLYTLTADATDDDGGNAVDDTAAVIVTGSATAARSKGYWYNQYKLGPPDFFSAARLQCYLDLVVFLSTRFNAPLTRAQATDLLKANAAGPNVGQFDAQLLAAWLNFANGSYDLWTPVDTDGNGSLDSTFGAAVLHAETVRNTPGASRSEILAQKDVLERLNLRDGG